MKAVYLRELRAYFTTVIGYLFIASMTLIVGVYAYVLNFVQRYPTFESTLYGTSFVYLLVIPILTMRSFSVAGEIILTVLYFWKPSVFENAFPKMMGSLALFARFDRFTSGLFDVGAVVYYLSVIFLFLFFSVLSLEKRRWS